MNALDRLRHKLDEAKIPYQSHCITYADLKEEYPIAVANMRGEIQ